MICKVLKGFWMGMAFLWIVGCNGDDSYMNSGGYCQNWSCKPSTDVLQRPSTFALELQLNDSADSRAAKLYTLDCQFLPDEDSLALSTFCVDSLKYGESDSLRHLPQKNKNSYDVFSDLSVNENGRVLEKYIKVPIDDDDHLRFTLVDRENKQKAFDVDLSAFIKMYELRGDTFDFRFPDSTFFVAYSRDTISDTGGDENLFTRSNEYGCYEYYQSSSTWMDTTLYCYVDPGDHYEDFSGAITSKDYFAVYLEDTSACLSHRFLVQEDQRSDFTAPKISCYRMDFAQAPDSLTLWNLYSVKEMDKVVKDSVGDRMQSNNVWGHRHIWHAVTHLSGQGPDGEDDFTIYTVYRD